MSISSLLELNNDWVKKFMLVGRNQDALRNGVLLRFYLSQQVRWSGTEIGNEALEMTSWVRAASHEIIMMIDRGKSCRCFSYNKHHHHDEAKVLVSRREDYCT